MDYGGGGGGGGGGGDFKLRSTNRVAMLDAWDSGCFQHRQNTHIGNGSGNTS